MLARPLVALLASSALIWGCADVDTDTAGAGTLAAALGFDGPLHDVEAVEIAIVALPGACGDTPVAVKTVAIEEEALPAHLEADPPGGNNHPFADGLFVLPPGDYLACATPLTADGVPTGHCAPTEGPATVLAEQTTEILLISQCLGDPSGALDVIVALNDPPQIDDLSISESKFIDVCGFADIQVTASDPNGDALTWIWAVTGAPDGGTGTLVGVDSQMDFTADTPGAYQVTVTVEDGHGASAQLSFPIHVSFAECGCDVGEVELSCAEELVYIHNAAALYAFDPATVTATLIGPFADAGGLNISNIFDLAIDPDGRLWGVSGTGVLYLVDPLTAEVTPLGGAGFKNGLTSLGDGTLIATGGDTVSELDPLTGAATPLLTSLGSTSSGDIVGTPSGALYWTVQGSGGDDWVQVDLDANTATVVGNTGFGLIYGLAWADGVLWGFTGNGLVLTIDPATGAVLSTGPLPPSDWFGATSNTSLF